MKHAVAASLVLAMSVCLPVGAAGTHVALLKNVAGTVRVERDSGPVDAKAGTVLYVADRLVAGPGASAGIVFKDGTLITLGAGAELQVRDYVFEPKEAKYAFSVHLAKGSAVYSSGKIGKLAPEAVKVSSPLATVGVRGTRFVIHAQ